MQAENRFLQQWNSYIRITGESGLRTLKLTAGLVVGDVGTKSGVCRSDYVRADGREGDMTTGAVVAASCSARG